MAGWAAFTAAEPRLAGQIQERFAIRKHKTLATLRKDGSPRISGQLVVESWHPGKGVKRLERR
jgi:hypothetical protein